MRKVKFLGFRAALTEHRRSSILIKEFSKGSGLMCRPLGFYFKSKILILQKIDAAARHYFNSKAATSKYSIGTLVFLKHLKSLEVRGGSRGGIGSPFIKRVVMEYKEGKGEWLLDLSLPIIMWKLIVPPLKKKSKSIVGLYL